MNKVTSWLKTTWNKTKGFFAFLFVTALLGGGWYIFLSLINKPPLETTPVMIMIWGSLLLLILAAFPQILNRVKKLKIGDFEVELQEVLRKSAKENLLSPSDFESPFFYEKGNIRRLKNLVISAIRKPNKTYFLIVNVFERRISIFALAAYLYFLGFVVDSVVVIFVSDTPHLQRPKSVRKSSILGVINGQIVLKEIILRYRNIYRQLVNFSTESGNDNFDNENDLLNFLNGIDLLWENHNNDFDEYSLTAEQVSEWFSNSMNTKMISQEINENDQEVLKRSLIDGDEFVIVADENILISVIPMCHYTGLLTLRIMNND